MGTSGLMLIPVTHPTQCVAECAKCGFSGQANTTWGPSRVQWVHRPNGPQFNMAVRITSEHAYRRNVRARIRAVHVIRVVAYRDCLTHKPITAHHLVLPDASALGIGVGLAVRWRLNVGYGPMRYPYFSYVEISALLTSNNRSLTRGIRMHTNFTFGMIQHKTASPRAIKALITNAWL